MFVLVLKNLLLQLWDGLRAGMKQGRLFAVQLDATKAAVLPAGPLAQLLVWPDSGASSPAELCRDRPLLAAAEAAVLGAKVGGQRSCTPLLIAETRTRHCACTILW